MRSRPRPRKSKVVIFASGSEVEIAIGRQGNARQGGHADPRRLGAVDGTLREQGKAYKEKLLGTEKIRIAIEAGVRSGWDRFIGDDGKFIGMTGFGASGPAEKLYEHFGITAKAVVKAAKK